MSPTRISRQVVAVVAAIFFLTACGGSGSSGDSSSANKGTITVAGFNFAESSILANIYGKALAKKGWTIKYKLNLGAREVVEPALEKGDIDLYPGYAATEVTFLKGTATTDPKSTVAALNAILSPKSLKALEPAAAQDQNAFAMTKEGAAKFGNPTKLSDLAAKNGQLVMGGPPECPTRPFCQKGLIDKYGLQFKGEFKKLDAGGPLTKAALDKGDIDLGLLFSSDGSIAAKGYVVLKDDKNLQNADNVVPVVRTATVNADAQSVLNDVSGKLTTDELAKLNKKVDVDKSDPDQVATDWLKGHGY
ncbi:MAG: ABC transporter substrate-binding protein [Candidatus Dormibacteria bacterium]